MGEWLNFNGRFIKEGKPVITADNRSFRYGDGLFETMRVKNDKIGLKELHIERLFSGMNLLNIQLKAGALIPDVLEKEIVNTVHKNQIREHARVRLAVFRGDGSLSRNEPGGYLIQAWDIPSPTIEKLQKIGVYTNAQKPCDLFSNCKSANYLVYIMAAQYAQQQGLSDCLVLNTAGRVCDATIANVFWVKDMKIFTPPLSEGCVAGVMRKHLLNTLDKKGYGIREKEAEVQELEEADELFLTNAIIGLRPVGALNGKIFGDEVARQVYSSIVEDGIM